jgi:hypothetical protein
MAQFALRWLRRKSRENRLATIARGLGDDFRKFVRFKKTSGHADTCCLKQQQQRLFENRSHKLF